MASAAKAVPVYSCLCQLGGACAHSADCSERKGSRTRAVSTDSGPSVQESLPAGWTLRAFGGLLRAQGEQ
eukprot:CAMPEP_0197871796 /NCGR_PEP_ID=MMETSP1439-20131203/2101_1 /TAXON_ID=66791 /ORGANISM="Gonyaulax spinifera, Strain CCMP409" /LENGTH=69 /DNA_ID=CAMNT_0043490753 /DNA_START=81 /DNA_END=290 /DNA_ORIENTATION=-